MSDKTWISGLKDGGDKPVCSLTPLRVSAKEEQGTGQALSHV